MASLANNQHFQDFNLDAVGALLYTLRRDAAHVRVPESFKL